MQRKLAMQIFQDFTHSELQLKIFLFGKILINFCICLENTKKQISFCEEKY